jgi:hypothetical protein
MHFPVALVLSHVLHDADMHFSDWSAVNPLQNECICHLFDGNLGELGALLQTWEIQATKGVIFKIQNNLGA